VSLFDVLRLPEQPIETKHIEVDASTTPRQLVVRTMTAINRLTIPAAVLMAVQQAAQATVPVAVGIAISRVIDAESLAPLGRWAIILAGLYLLLATTYRLAFRLEILAMQVVIYQLRLRVARAVLDPRRIGRELPGVGLSIFVNDVNRLGLAPGLLVYPVGNVVAVAVVAVVLFAIAWPIGLAVLVGTPAMLVVLNRVGRPLQHRALEQSQRSGDATSAAADLLTGLRDVKGLGAEAEASARYARESDDVLTATLRAKTTFAWYQMATSIVSGLFVAGVAVLIGALALHGWLTVGEIVTAIGLAAFVASPIRSLTSDVVPQWNEANAAAQRVLSVLQAPRRTQHTGANLVPGVAVSLEVDGVVFGTTGPLTFTAAPGELVGVVADGATALRLEQALSLHRPPDAGVLRLGGIELDRLDDASLRQSMLVAPHSADLFSGTILDNVEPLVAPQGPTPTGVRAAAAAACDDVVDTRTDGWSAAVGHRGSQLSGGQRQRIALARALAATPPVLVLRDPTTSVDSITEAAIAGGIRAMRRGMTTVLITTSPALLAEADRVVWVSQHRVAEASHADLLDDPVYAEVFA